MRREREGGHRLWNIFHVFCCNTCFFAGPVSLGVRPLFRDHSKMGTATFGCLHIVEAGLKMLSLLRHVRPPTNSFLVFYFAALTAFPFEFLPANQNSLSMSICCRYVSIFNLGVCCYDLDFGNLLLSLSLSLSLSIFLYLSIYLSLVSHFSYMFLSFLPSRGGPVNLARKQPQSTGFPNYFTYTLFWLIY